MVNAQKAKDSIRFGEKIAFAIGSLGSVPYLGLITAFLMIFYTDVVGLNPAAVATLFLITRILDAVNDPQDYRNRQQADQKD